MDRAGRSFLAVAAAAVVFGGYGLCALIAYGVLPLAAGRSQDDGDVALVAVAALTVLLAFSAFRAVRTLWREVVAARALSRHIEAAAMPIPPRLRRAGREAGLAGRVRLVDSAQPCSFVYGALAPRVVLGAGLLSRLSEAELRAALEHERYHVLNLDPLRDTLARAAVDALFFLPALRSIYRRYEAARELAADRRAVTIVGRRPLAAALLKAMEAPGGDRPASIALAQTAVMASRLLQLETGREPDPKRIGALSLGTSALGALAFLALLVAVPLAIGGGSALSRELGPASLLEGAALCLAPLAATAAVGYRRLAVRSAGYGSGPEPRRPPAP